MQKLLPYLTVRNAKMALTVIFALASLFGFLAPDEATRLRNKVMVPLDIIAPGTVDIL